METNSTYVLTKEEEQMGRIRVMVPQLLAEHNLKAKDLERIMGVSKPTALKLAKGIMPWIRPDQLTKLCEYFNVDIGEILVYRQDREGVGVA